MLEFVIFAVTFAAALIAALFYLYPGSRRQTTIAGIDPSHPSEGNVADIIRARSVHQFVSQLHRKFGPIVSFWLFGPTLTVSVRTEEIVKSLDYLTEKPKEVNELFLPFLGSKSVLFAEKHDLRRQRAIWHHMFDPKSVDSQRQVIRELISELILKWSTLPDRQHIPVGNYMKAFTIRLSLVTGFGNYFRNSNTDLIEFSRSFENCFTELEARNGGDLPAVKSVRDDKFEESVDKCRKLLKKAVEHLRTNRSAENTGLLAHFLDDSSISDQHLIDESITFVFMYYSLSSALVWSLYYLSAETQLQTELSQKFRFDIESDLIEKFIDSAISSANVIQWTSRVNPDVDNQLEGHLVPKGTPIIMSLSSDHFMDCSTDSALDVFRKHFDSFEDHNQCLAFGSKTSKRCCPAIQYSKFIIKELIMEIIKNFEIQSIDSDLIPTQIYKIYSKSEEEIWITIKKRIEIK